MRWSSLPEKILNCGDVVRISSGRVHFYGESKEAINNIRRGGGGDYTQLEAVNNSLSLPYAPPIDWRCMYVTICVEKILLLFFLTLSFRPQNVMIQLSLSSRVGKRRAWV